MTNGELTCRANSAHSASVPISVHLDHATDAEQLELAVGLAEKGIKFDSIMVDASHADVSVLFSSRRSVLPCHVLTVSQTDEENISIAIPWIKRCVAAGVATEVELGRLEGGEAGLRQIEGTIMTDPAKAETFMKESVFSQKGRLDAILTVLDRTGANILAPCVGNRHGSYKPFGGADGQWDMGL